MKRNRIWEGYFGGDLAPPDPALFEFLPRKGFRYRGDRKSVVFSNMSITKANMRYDDYQIYEFAKAVQIFADSMANLGDHKYEPTNIFRKNDFRIYKSSFAYKFLSEKSYEHYFSKGHFLVSSLGRFRELEHQGDPAGDRFEGSAFSCYDVADRQLTIQTLSGFDANIFSLARDLKNIQLMKDRFGPVVMKIQLEPFARGLAHRLLGQVPDIRLVRYSDLKIFRDVLSLSDVAGYPPALTANLAKALREKGWLPSLFAKPNRFAEEREVRIVVRSPCDVESMTGVNAPELLKFVKRIDV